MITFINILLNGKGTYRRFLAAHTQSTRFAHGASFAEANNLNIQ